MTPEQHRLYQAALRVARAFGTGGALWVGQRATAGTPATDAVINNLPLVTIRFLENNRPNPIQTLPQTPLFTARWWGIAAAGSDIQVDDLYSNGTIAFRVIGAPDTSQGFVIAPAAFADVPPGHTQGNYQAGLRTGAW